MRDYSIKISYPTLHCIITKHLLKNDIKIDTRIDL